MTLYFQAPTGAQQLGDWRVLRLFISAIVSIIFALLSTLPAHAQSPQSRYRLYHPSLQTHLYTTDLNEYTVLGTRGWSQENEAHRVFTAAGSYNGGLLQPYFRLFNGNLRIHFWTTDRNEYDVLSRAPGYVGENIESYLLVAPQAGAVPLFRLVLLSTAKHLWTTDENEKNVLTQRGWGFEGIDGYVLPVTPVVASTFTQTQAARLLTQATWGPNMVEINRTQALGARAWVEDQFLRTSLDKHFDYVARGGAIGCNPCDSKFINAAMETFWLQAIKGEDQLRQRIVFALTEIFVVSTVNSAVDIQAEAHAAYLDMLAKNSFGNFRTLLEDVARHPTMGHYLSHIRNEKADLATGRLPDENFAREVMQLFSIGLWQLNADGTRRKDASGADIPTYIQADILGMARVLTGLSWGGPDTSDARWSGIGGTDPDSARWDVQMQMYPNYHSPQEKRIISGVIIPANTDANTSLKIALDTIFNHPNVGPFIGEQLIKRFVTSNPSRAYVGRVSAAFANNGSSVRGDMKAVIRAILLDTEARDDAKLTDPTFGKLREPLVRFGNYMRAFNVATYDGRYKIHNLEDPVSSLGQNPLRAPSVFNWFRPDHAPSGDILSVGLVAPEFQITHETTVTGYTNFIMETADRDNESAREIFRQYGSVQDFLAGNTSVEIALADKPQALLDRLNLLLLSGRLTPSTRAIIADGLADIAVDSYRWRENRVSAAIGLIMAAPEYVVQK